MFLWKIDDYTLNKGQYLLYSFVGCGSLFHIYLFKLIRLWIFRFGLCFEQAFYKGCMFKLLIRLCSEDVENFIFYFK